jgi:arginase family enzyme
MKIDNSVYKFKESRVCFIGLPRTNSFTPRKLSSNSTDLLRFALNNKDDYDTKTKSNVFDNVKICDLGNVKDLSFMKNYNNQSLFFLGGEHNIANEITNELMYKHKDLHIIIFDAHLDCRETGEPNATFLRKVIERMPKEQIHLIGQRIYSKEEEEFIKSKGLEIKDSVELKNKNIYISFDIDVIDDIYVPTCSTPEPFGKSLKYYNDLLTKLANNNKLIGIDFVEFSGEDYDITYSNIASIIMNLLKTFLNN